MNLTILLHDNTKRNFSGITIDRAMNILKFYKQRVKHYNLTGKL